MTLLLDQAIETIRTLSPETQDALARILLQLAGDDQSVVQLSEEEEFSFDASFAQAERREFATRGADWEDSLKKHGL